MGVFSIKHTIMKFTYPEAIKFCYEQRRGFTNDLEREIGKANYSILCTTGLIKHGVELEGEQSKSTWAITDEIKEEYDLYFGKPSEEDIRIAKELEVYFM